MPITWMGQTVGTEFALGGDAIRGTRPLALAAATVLTALVAGCDTDTDTDAAAPAVTSGPSAPAATGPAPAGSPSAAAERAVIASSALLQAEDLRGSTLEPLAEGQSAYLRPARPCDTPYPSDATRTTAVAMRAQVQGAVNETPTIVIQYVGLHPGHAAEAFAEISAALRRCPGSLEPGQRQWAVAGTGIAGDESMLLRVTQRLEYGGAMVTTTTPVVVARIGDHLTVVADLGWESAGGDEAYVRQLAARAVERLRTGG